MNPTDPCSICEQPLAKEKPDLNSASDITFFDCPICGEYGLSGQTKLAISALEKDDKTKLSAYLRERKIQKEPIITLLTKVLSGDSCSTPAISFEDVLRERFPLLVSDRLDRILRNIHMLSTYPGENIRFSFEQDYPVFFAENSLAMQFLSQTLQEKGLISFSLSMQMIDVKLTEAGWARIAEIERGETSKDLRQVFVAMWFDEALQIVWREGFKKAIEETGCKAFRIDLQENNNKICDSIIAEIRKSRYLVADFTGHRGGVYFEAGFAKGLGMEVIWTCRENDKDGLHFDTRQYNHILWKNEKDLYDQLKRRIEATIPL